VLAGAGTRAQASMARQRPPAASAPAPLFSPADAGRLRAYQERLATAAALPALDSSLATLLQPLLALAETRSATSSPSDENRIALIARAFYVNGWPLAALTPEARDWPTAPRRSVTLRGRGDLAQHFTVSALIAAAAGGPLANAAGIYKEVDDARRGSGFSFSDLAADRAGTLFGLLSTRSADSAKLLHSRLAATALREDDMMPAITGLPDNLPEAEFARRFGGVGGPGYTSLAAEIERRLTQLPLFRAGRPE
jgi:uncharacterized protein YfiM (DUF2279 family)